MLFVTGGLPGGKTRAMAVYSVDGMRPDAIVRSDSIMNNVYFFPVSRTAVPSPRICVDYEKLFVSHLAVIDGVVAQVCRRHHLRQAEVEDFASDVKLHLIERDYEVLRRFQHRSSMHTYLIVVVQRLFLDYRNRLWGRWRPSAEALRAGPLATLMERLIARDGWGLDEALEQLRTNYNVQERREELGALAARLSLSPSARRFVSEDLADEIPGHEPAPDASIVRAERDVADRRVRLALDHARQTLTSEDRLLLKMRFDDGFTVARIAKTLHLQPKPLYRRFERLFVCLRERLIAQSISRDEVRGLFDGSDFDGDSNAGARVFPFGLKSATVAVTSNRKREETRG